MSTLQRPALRRTAATQPIRASFFDESNDARNSPEAMQLRQKITTAYDNTPFRGPAFQLPSGAVVVEDMWLASLNTTIDEILDEGLDGLKEFANDLDEKKGWVGKWLKHKVSLEGKDQDKYYYEALARKLWPHKYDTDTPNPYPPMPNPITAGDPYRSLETPADFIRAGLPMNMTDMVHQPQQEVEVYRDLGNFQFPEDDEDDDEKKAEDDDMAEGA